MRDDELVQLLEDVVGAVGGAIEALDDWDLVPDGAHASQYGCDVVADAAALDVLRRAGVGVLSEESGLHTGSGGAAGIVVVVDPIDGSTNASRRIPWYCTSLCAVDETGARAALVKNHATGTAYAAVRGRGATVDGLPLVSPDGRPERLGDAIVGLQGWPHEHLGWKQFRAMGAAALDLCAVAAGLTDAYIDCVPDALNPWDYLGGVLVCREAGVEVVDAFGRALDAADPGVRRTPIAAANRALLDEALAARARLDARS